MNKKRGNNSPVMNEAGSPHAVLFVAIVGSQVGGVE
jgi:hypothetical protein